MSSESKAVANPPALYPVTTTLSGLLTYVICYYTIININPGKSIPIKVIDNHFPTFVNKLSLYLIDNISAGIKNINE